MSLVSKRFSRYNDYNNAILKNGGTLQKIN
jgi:hypothetical protein